MSKEKKILLHTDETKILSIKKDANDSVTSLNAFIGNCAKVCDMTFDKKQKDGIRDNGVTFIIDHLKPEFPHPKATDKINLQTLGIDLDKLQALEKYPVWRQYPIEQNENGVFELASDPEQIQSCYYYTENDKQVEAYNLAVKISNLINEAIAENFIPERQAYKFIGLEGILTANSEQTRAKPDNENIARLK